MVSKASLCGYFTELYGTLLPKRASAAFLRSNIAWALQAHAAGKDPASLREALVKAVNHPSHSKYVRYKPGSRLIREWQGAIYEVTVLEKGYRWQGRQYQSLSRIAEEITGAHWSGPRFFGTGRGSP